MIDYRKILALSFDSVSQRTISFSNGHARNTVSEVIQRATNLGITQLNNMMTNVWLEEFLYPEKQAIEKGYYPFDWEKVHKEPQKKHVTLKLLYHELIGASGNGKTYIANAFGVHACSQFYKVKYIRLPELLDELAVVKYEADGSYRKKS